MTSAESHRWTWTLGVLTAASACLLPVGADASVEESDECGASEYVPDVATPQGVAEHAVPCAGARTECEWGPSIAGVSPRSAADLYSSRQPFSSLRSQLLSEPGPPIYLVAPSQSPPGASSSPVESSVS